MRRKKGANNFDQDSLAMCMKTMGGGPDNLASLAMFMKTNKLWLFCHDVYEKNVFRWKRSKELQASLAWRGRGKILLKEGLLDLPWVKAGYFQAGGTAVHPGITIHKIPVVGPIGLVVTVGVVAMVLLSLPEARWFLALSLPTGVAIAIILRLTR